MKLYIHMYVYVLQLQVAICKFCISFICIYISIAYVFEFFIYVHTHTHMYLQVCLTLRDFVVSCLLRTICIYGCILWMFHGCLRNNWFVYSMFIFAWHSAGSSQSWKWDDKTSRIFFLLLNPPLPSATYFLSMSESFFLYLFLLRTYRHKYITTTC